MTNELKVIYTHRLLLSNRGRIQNPIEKKIQNLVK